MGAQARLRLRYRLFERVVNFSLNSVQDGVFMFRTIREVGGGGLVWSAWDVAHTHTHTHTHAHRSAKLTS